MHFFDYENKRGSFRLVVFLFFVIGLFLFKLTYQEMWKDEWQAWLVAKDLDWSALFNFLYYEGHPIFWYAYLKLLSELEWLVSSEIILQVGHLMPVIGVLYLLFFRFQFSYWFAFLISGGYYFLFEYGVVNRGYIFVILFGGLLSLLLKRPAENKWVIGILMVLLCQTEVYGLIVAAALLFYIFLFYLKSGKDGIRGILKGKAFLIPAVGAFLGLIFFLLTILPGSEVTEGYVRKAILFSTLNGDGIAKAFQGLWGNTFFIGLIPDTNLFGYSVFGIMLSFITCLMLFWLFKGQTKVFLTFIFFTLLLFTFSILFYTGGVRHWGMYLIFWVFCLQLWSYERPEIKLKRGLIILSIAITQMVYSIRAISKEVSYPFSHAKEVAHYIQSTYPQGQPIVAISKFAAVPVIGYLGFPLYALPDGKEFTYFQWLEKIYLPPLDELFLFAQYKETAVLPILSFQKLDPVRYPSLLLRKTWDSFNLKQENYYLYELHQSAYH